MYILIVIYKHILLNTGFLIQKKDTCISSDVSLLNSVICRVRHVWSGCLFQVREDVESMNYLKNVIHLFISFNNEGSYQDTYVDFFFLDVY